MVTALVTYFTTKNTKNTDVMCGVAFFGCVVDVTVVICVYKLLKPLIQ
ncbi:hypothetical protein VPHD249_0051 [Vibrio phage D249]|nr:hypothetical protein SIPHO036v1_140003 [Vibrio phage 70E38.1]QZI87964.1 hypothetical protein SIPHO041v1_p0053 [Vibrio phage 234P1]QZI88134.1 hypothetical protein SIPHO035v1_p0043 [Vibrio phage 234P7B]QZI88502.1 hypothetical protein SIPHO037v1_p0061 [Vibrio phage 70E35.2]QZI88686.1 hypothetical protein SIPHO039v1_p0057 [Vibrio phage 70E35.5a]QZI88871.1 hypothetical protein SIPHO040v1_p0058 [Vibrio phage 70E35.6]QZI89150.1 hypothetical protein SIPHO042v1_p0153 [Vibrio phage 70E37.1]QZI89318